MARRWAVAVAGEWCRVFKFLHAADLHLDSPLRGLDRYDGCPADAIRGATRQSLERLVRLAIGERVSFVLIAGDVYDGDWPDHGTGLFFARKMAELRDAGIPVVLISGNHDAKNRMTRELRLPDGVHLLDSGRPETVHLADADVAIHGQSFATERVSDDLSRRYPGADPGCFNIGLLHTSADGREGVARYAPCTVDALRGKGYDYWALGHVHTREEVDTRDAPIVFPGNIQGRHIREPGAKGCVVVEVDGRTTTRVFHPLDVLRWATCRIDAAELGHADDVPAALAERVVDLVLDAEGRSLAVRVEVVGATPLHDALHAHPAQLVADCQNAANQAGRGRVWVEKVRCRTSPPRLGPDGLDATWDGPMGEVDRILAELRADPAHLLRFAAAELGDLAKKLPAELSSDDGIDLGSAGFLGSILDGVRPLLDAQFRRARGAS